MKVLYEHRAVKPRFPYLVIQESERSYYKVLVRDRFLFVSNGAAVLDRGAGELDVPSVGVGRRPIGDYVYDSADEAGAAFARCRTEPASALRLVLAGRKP